MDFRATGYKKNPDGDIFEHCFDNQGITPFGAYFLTDLFL
jgi:hypothetical protein